MKSVVFAIIFFASTAPLAAQWLTYPTPGIPRTADGKPNLTAPAPRTADGKPIRIEVSKVVNGGQVE